MKKVFILVASLLNIFLVSSQELLFQDYEISQDYYAKFINFGRNDGLPDNRINAFTQDADGFIWIGTQKGLSRFDGYTFRNYFHQKNNTKSLADNQINALCADMDGVLWVGTSQGLARYNQREDNFDRVKIGDEREKSMVAEDVGDMMVDNEGRLWILMRKGAVYVKKPDAVDLQFVFQLKTGGSSYTQGAMMDDGIGHVWISAAFVEGLLKVEKSTLKAKLFFEFPLSKEVWGMTHFQPNCGFVKTRSNDLFMCSIHGVLSKFTDERLLIPTIFGNIYTAVIDSKGIMWLGGYAHGLLRVDQKEKKIKQYKVNGDEQWSINHNQILKLFADREDNIWLATANGLSMLSSSRFKFKHLRHMSAIKNSIPSNRIATVHQAPDQTLWVGTENAGLFSMKNNELDYYEYDKNNPKSLGSNNVTDIATTPDGSVWISLWNGFEGGLNRFDPVSKSFLRIDKPKRSYWNSSVATTGDGNLYLGCWGPGLFIMDPKRVEIVTPPNYGLDAFTASKVVIADGKVFGGLNWTSLTGSERKIYVPPSVSDYGLITVLPAMKEVRHQIYLFDTALQIEYGFAVSGHLYRFNILTEKLDYLKHESSQPKAMAVHDRQLFVADTSGLWIIPESAFSASNIPQQATVKRAVYDLKIKGNDLWVLERDRISLFNNNRLSGWRNFGMIPDSPTRFAFLRDKEVILTDGKRLWVSMTNGQTKEIAVNPDVLDKKWLKINDLFFFEGRLWMATNQGLLSVEVSRMLQNSRIDRTIVQEFVSSYNVIEIQSDGHGLLYATSDKGLFSVKPANGEIEEMRYRTSPKLLWNTLVSMLSTDRSGRLWIGTNSDCYLACYDPSTGSYRHYIRREGKQDQVIGSNIQAVFVDSNHQVWVGTDEAFMKLDESTGRFSPISLSDKGTMGVSSIVADQKNRLWLGTVDGLFQFNSEAGVPVRRYTVDDGLQSNEFGAGSVLLPDGKVIVSGLRGMNIFDPDRLVVDTVAPQPRVVAFIVDTINVMQRGIDTPLQFSYGKSDYHIVFSAMKFANAHKSSYSWRLDGFDEQWRNSGPGEHRALYSNLWPGEYTLWLKAANADGLWSEPVVALRFVISPPFWMTWWFVTIVMLLLILIIFLLYRWRIERLKYHQKLLERTVKERTIEIAEKNEVLQVQYEAIHVKNEEILAQRDEIEAQRDQIESQRDEVMAQKDLISLQKKAMTDSIEYARRIQQATLPHNELNCSAFLAGCFVFHQPRDIVSGDFYWASCRDDVFVVAVADCTGHGVPGAFMSMLGISFLNKIVNEERVTSPDEILNLLRKNIIMALHQSGQSKEAADGMDISVVSIMADGSKMLFAGANSQILFFRQGVSSLYKGDKMPVSYYEKMTPFHLHEIDCSGGDLLYLYTDGYGDQFGGVSGVKLKSRFFREMLGRVAMLPFEQQGTAVDHDFFGWKGNNDQVDDVTVIGLLLR